MEEQERMMTVREISNYCRLSTEIVSNMVRRGELAGVGVGPRCQCRESDVRKWAATNRRPWSQHWQYRSLPSLLAGSAGSREPKRASSTRSIPSTCGSMLPLGASPLRQLASGYSSVEHPLFEVIGEALKGRSGDKVLHGPYYQGLSATDARFYWESGRHRASPSGTSAISECSQARLLHSTASSFLAFDTLLGLTVDPKVSLSSDP